jgi:hypothetical protein
MLGVVDAQPAAAAVLPGLGDVGGQLSDDEPDTAGGGPSDPLPVCVQGERSGSAPSSAKTNYADGRTRADSRVIVCDCLRLSNSRAYR